jgi:hypothetical protein
VISGAIPANFAGIAQKSLQKSKIPRNSVSAEFRGHPMYGSAFTSNRRPGFFFGYDPNIGIRTVMLRIHAGLDLPSCAFDSGAAQANESGPNYRSIVSEHDEHHDGYISNYTVTIR